jgi:hypothetical protein
MNREIHVRFSEGLVVRLRWATRPNRGETSMSYLVSPPIRIPESVGHSLFE